MKTPLLLGLAFILAVSAAVFSPEKAAAVNAASTAEATPTPKPADPIFGRNLITNSNAESGSGSWTNFDSLKTLIYGEFGGGPYPDSPGPKDRGERYFYAKVTTEAPSVVCNQTIQLAAVAKEIEAGTVKYSFGGWFGGVNTSFSSARLRVVFLDAAGKELGRDETAEVKESDRADDLVLVERQRSGTVPKGAAKARVELEFYIRKGHEGENLDTNAYADNLSFVLNKIELLGGQK